jgi:hypothetical protein
MLTKKIGNANKICCILKNNNDDVLPVIFCIFDIHACLWERSVYFVADLFSKFAPSLIVCSTRSRLCLDAYSRKINNQPIAV